MKRIKHEQIQSAVGSYLRKRHYTDSVDSLSKKKIPSHNLMQKVLYNTVAHSVSAGNVVSFSATVSDPENTLETYKRFIKFLQTAIEPHRTELLPLIYPVVVHLFLELMCNGHTAMAQQLLSLSRSQFDPDDMEKSGLLDSLLDAYNWKSAMANDELVEFREHKYVVVVCYDAANYLLHFIRREDNLVLLQLFNQHIDLKVTFKDSGEDLELFEGQLTAEVSSMKSVDNIKKEVKSEGESDVGETGAKSWSTERKKKDTPVSLESLKQAADNLRKRPPTLPSILQYNSHSKQRQTCASISHDKSLLCGGFEDSSIQLWSLLPTPLETKPSTCDISHMYMYGDQQEHYLQKIQKDCGERDTVRLRGHSGTVYSTKFTTDKQNLLSASEDTTVQLWSMETHCSQVMYRAHTGPVWDLDISSVSSYFVSCSKDRTAKFWSMDRIYPLRNMLGHLQDVDCVRFHPNGTYIATGSTDTTLRLWSVQHGRTVRLFNGHRGGILTLAFSPDGKMIASAGEDRHVKLWDLNSGALLKDFRGHTDTINTVCFSQDNTMLASGGLDETLKIWDVRNEKFESKSETSSPELLHSYTIKSSTLLHLSFTQHNLLMAATTDII